MKHQNLDIAEGSGMRAALSPDRSFPWGIAIVTQPLDGKMPPPRNSIGILSCEFGRHLARDCRVVVFTIGSRFRGGVTLEQGVEYVHLPQAGQSALKRLAGPFLNRGGVRRPGYASPAQDLTYALQVAWRSRARDLKIVHVFNNSHFLPIIRALHPASRIVLHMECEWLTQLDSGWIKPRLDAADRIVGCSDFVTDGIRRRFPDLADRCATVYNGVDVKRFSPPTTTPTREDSSRLQIVFIGRLSPEKGVHVLIEAFAEVVKAVPEARLDLVGSTRAAPAEYIVDVSDDPLTHELARFYPSGNRDAYVENLRQQVSESNLDNHVRFREPLLNDDVPAALREADLFVFPSVWEEPFGIPPVEAMSSGVPVVVTRSGGMAETVRDGIEGHVVERNDPHALAGAIISLLRSRQLRHAMGKCGRERALDLFSYDAVSRRLLDLYQEIVAKG